MGEGFRVNSVCVDPRRLLEDWFELGIIKADILKSFLQGILGQIEEAEHDPGESGGVA